MFDSDKTRGVLWGLGGGYVAYLGLDLIVSCVRGEAGYPAVGAAAGALFVAVGGALMFLAWRKYHQSDD